MVLIYSNHITPRLTYALDIVFKIVLNSTYQLTKNKEEFLKSELPKISYTDSREFEGVYIKSNGILFENSINYYLPFAEQPYEDFPKFFKSNDFDFLGYDILSMAFYFASRYEEYLKTDVDEHQRFQAEKSLAYQYHCLQIPFLNIAIQQFADKLKQQFKQLSFTNRTLQYLSTIDIDNAFAYAHKGIKRNVGGLMNDVFAFKYNHVLKRIISNLNDEKDPYNTFSTIDELSADTKTALQYFVLIGDYSSFDKNPHYSKPGFRKLLKDLSQKYNMGLHPSYMSFNDLSKIGVEKKRLEDIIEIKVTSARCHFLRVKIPDTYRTFIEQGITDDYTMIYASECGYRTGLCTPYPWFDLEKNEATSLMIHPSIVMEGTLRDYNKMLPQQAKETISRLLNETKKHGGEFVSVWHNDSFVPEQKEWIEVYKELLLSSKI